ncbi:MAG: hypothetical protein ACKO7V_03165 [Bacteroidota bacterium]
MAVWFPQGSIPSNMGYSSNDLDAQKHRQDQQIQFRQYAFNQCGNFLNTEFHKFYN